MAIAKEIRSGQDFEEVVVEGHGELVLTQGDQETLEIEADAELLPKIKSEV
jgi:predicted transcriptional regulator